MDFRAFLFLQENKLTSRLYFEYISILKQLTGL